MKRLIAFSLIAYLLITTLPVSAQTATPVPHIFEHGVYQFEDTVSDMTYGGSWTSECSNGFCFRRGDNGATVSFYARGLGVVIYRETIATFYGIAEICVSSTCADYVNNEGNSLPIVLPLPDAVSAYQISITVTYYYRFDSFMVLGNVGDVLPTATPINTPLPTATPISTWTPGPSITPQPTATPQPSSTPLSLIWSVDPTCKYSSTDSGQITCERYEVDPTGVFNGILLFALVILTTVSLWFNARRIVE